YAGIDKIRLTFKFVCAQSWQQTVAALEPNAGPEQSYALARPKTERASGEIRHIYNCVKSPGRAVERLFIPRCEKERPPEPQPIPIDGKFQGGLLSVDIGLAPRNRIEVIVTEGLVERMRNIKAAYVAVPRPPQVHRFDAVSDHIADGG